MDLADLADPGPWLTGAALLLVVYGTRAASLATACGQASRALVFLAPRGLITILLAQGIPPAERSRWVGPGALLILILGTSLLQVLAGRKVAESAGVAILDRLALPRAKENP